MKDDLRKGGMFKIDAGVNRPRKLEDFLRKSRKYIDYEENDLAGRSATGPISERDSDQKESRQKKYIWGAIHVIESLDPESGDIQSLLS